MKQAWITGVLLLVTVSCGGAVWAQEVNEFIRPSAPTERFAVNADGTVSDTLTGLTWQQCAQGQTWGAEGCSGTAAAFTWQQALQQVQTANNDAALGFSDWRLPNVKELTSLVEIACYDPMINLEVFPATPSSGFWSSSPYEGFSVAAWYVNFDESGADLDLKEINHAVKMVRGGR